MTETVKIQETEDQCGKVRVHRVGTFTAGIMLVVCGILFMLHQFLPDISYELIFRLWPCILIALGTELLIADRSKNVKYIYDAGAIMLMILLSIFAMCMAGADFVMHNAKWF